MASTITALDAAQYLLTLDDPSAGDATSNLKLQKLLYYAQGVHLAMHDAPMFHDTVCAWQHGPVVASVYHAYKDCGAAGLPRPDNFDPALLGSSAREVLDEVHTVYGQFSAWRLREMTHAEPPWKDNFKDGVMNIEIPHEHMQRFFKSRLIG
jgi:uncharacterized phage-associated protein